MLTPSSPRGVRSELANIDPHRYAAAVETHEHPRSTLTDRTTACTPTAFPEESRHGGKATTNGGYVVGAGSVRAEGYYRVKRHGRIADLPAWLTHALTPATAVAALANTPPLPRARASAYVNAIVEREARAVAAATQGTRHHTLLRAARILGSLVGGGELEEATAKDVLHAAAAAHIGVAGTTSREVIQTVDDGIAYGRQAPRRIRR